MKRLLTAVLLILLSIPAYGIELSDPDPEDTRRITAIIQYTSEFRFGDNLKKGDEVVYEVNDETQSEEYADHTLRVIDRNNNTTTVLELFEGNELFVEFFNKTKEVVRIWGKDIVGGDHELTLLSQQEVEEVVGKTNIDKNPMKELCKWKVTTPRENYSVKDKQIQCKLIELDIDETLPSKVQDGLRENSSEISVLMSNDVPKMLPLVPVAVACTGKKEFLMDNAGFVRNNNLRLKSYRKGD
ncbi:MAG: hypothetical protein K9M99_00935 [Candidatus Cloacimonetes bacterium]|nr:hypothetical protein [Candidatus Cloacimonadota bacterium]